MRKLIWMIWGISILCAAPSVKAAQVKEVKTPVYSIADLKARLYKLIQEKYPEAHVDNRKHRDIISFYPEKYKYHIDREEPYSSTKSKDYPSDYSVFTLRLAVGDEDTYTNKITRFHSSERPEPFGTRFHQAFKIQILTEDIPDDAEIADVPQYHWIFQDADLFVYAGLVDDYTFRTCLGCLPVMRHQIAVVTARITDAYIHKEEIKKKIDGDPKLKKAFNDLQQEFAPELTHWNLPIINQKIYANGKAWPPRYRVLTISFVYGKGVDPQLTKVIKCTVSDYAAAWFKSNLLKQKNITAK